VRTREPDHADGRGRRPDRHPISSRRLPKRWRNLLLTAHIVVAVGALGTDGVLLTLAAAGIGPAAVRVTTAPAVGVLLLTTAVVLAVYKPWGQTRLRRRIDGN
jgi:hypothetical protein